MTKYLLTVVLAAVIANPGVMKSVPPRGSGWADSIADWTGPLRRGGTDFISLPQTATSKTASSPATEIANIDRYEAEVDRFVKRNVKSAKIFGDMSSATNDEKSNWKKFKTEKEREAAGLYDTAEVWMRAGKVVRTNFTFSSESGDWAHFVYYSFRDDGSLAKIHGQLNTFYGDISVVSDHYYSRDGKLLKTKRLFLDLKTQKPKKPGDYQPKEPEPVYKKVSDLPYFKLL